MNKSTNKMVAPGAKEAIEIEQYVNNLPSKTYDVFKIQITNRNLVQYIIGIDKH